MTIKLNTTFDVWGLCPSYLDIAKNGVVDLAKVAANVEYKRKLVADDTAVKLKT